MVAPIPVRLQINVAHRGFCNVAKQRVKHAISLRSGFLPCGNFPALNWFSKYVIFDFPPKVLYYPYILFCFLLFVHADINECKLKQWRAVITPVQKLPWRDTSKLTDRQTFANHIIRASVFTKGVYD